MPPERSHGSCLATATDDRFVEGTAVLLYSFLRHNPWFTGEIVVFHNGLSPRSRRVLDVFDRVECRRVGRALRSRLVALRVHHPRLARSLPRFHSLEAFGLSRFRRVVYLDSDILCAGDASRLFELPDGFHACPDLPSLQGMGRDAHSFSPTPLFGGEPSHEVLSRTFNSGVMVLGPSARRPEVVDDLLARVHPLTWVRTGTGHTDQFVLNQAFRDRWTPLPERFNRLVTPRAADAPPGRSTLDGAVFIHFVGKPKPWTVGKASGPGEVDGLRRAARSRWECERQELARDHGPCQ